MKIAAFADLHLSRLLYGKKRTNDCESVLQDISGHIHKERPNLLLIAGDIYHTGQPSPQAQKLYLDFLSDVSSAVDHVVVIAGNHDSLTLVDAGRKALLPLNIHISSSVDGFGGAEPFILRLDKLDCGICAVPCLPDSVVRQVSSGLEAPEKKWIAGMSKIYEEALLSMTSCKTKIAMGHFTAQGAKLLDERVVGDAEVPADVFSGYDLCVLGHIHLPQSIGKNIVYPGSPYAQTFEEAESPHSFCFFRKENGEFLLERVPLAPATRLVTISSNNHEEILEKLKELTLLDEGRETWVKIRYGGLKRPSLRQELDEIIASNHQVEVLCVEVPQNKAMPIASLREEEVLSELSPIEVFSRLMDSKNVPAGEQIRLTRDFKKLLERVGQD